MEEQTLVGAIEFPSPEFFIYVMDNGRAYIKIVQPAVIKIREEQFEIAEKGVVHIYGGGEGLVKDIKEELTELRGRLSNRFETLINSLQTMEKAGYRIEDIRSEDEDEEDF